MTHVETKFNWSYAKGPYKNDWVQGNCPFCSALQTALTIIHELLVRQNK